MNKYGSFSGNPKTEWLVDEFGADRDMKLLEEFSYTDPNGKKWIAPIGSHINGASIPRPLWSTVGSPYTDDYRRASIIHDVACDDPEVNRKDADVMFYYACLAGGCSLAQAKLLYAGVRIGAWANNIFSLFTFSANRMLFNIPFKPSSDELFIKNKFQEIAIDLETLNDDASIKDIDAVIDRHIKF